MKEVKIITNLLNYREIKERHNLVNILLIGYLLVVVGFMLFKNISITPDRFLIILLFGAVLVGRPKTFLKDWIPFIGLLLGYELLRGFADTAGFTVNVGNIVEFERSIFGFIPTEALQARFFDPNNLHIWDRLAVLIDFLHFPLPLLVAFYLWINDKKHYWRFVTGLLTLSFAAFVTYIFFPAAPPWYAAREAGLLEVHKIIDIVVSQIGWGWNFSEVYNNLNPNPVAAIPSLHSAYPWLAFLALYSFKKKIGLIFLPYPFLVWMSVVYLGEHYVVDVLAGITYASCAFVIAYKFADIKKFSKRLFKNIENKEIILNEGKG